MKILSRRGIPAVSALDINAEPVWTALMAGRELGETDQIKQMIGHQVRQVMEIEGYRKVGSKPIRTSWLFTAGSYYRHPEWFRLFVHKNRDLGDPEGFCIASKRQLGALLNPPPNSSKWVPYRVCYTRSELNFVLDANLDDDFGLSWLELREKVDDQGYFVLRY